MSVVLVTALGAIVSVIAIAVLVRVMLQRRYTASVVALNRSHTATPWNDAIYGLDVDGRLTFVNDAAEALTGTPSSVLVGKFAHDVMPLPENLPSGWLPDDFSIRERMQWKRRRRSDSKSDSRIVPLEVTVRATKAREAKGTTVLVIARDLSLPDSPIQLKDEFISAISQEVRSPMTLIQGYLELMIAGELGDVSEEQRTSLNTVLVAAAQLQGFIEDMLTVAESRTGVLELGLSNFDLADIVRDQYAMMSDSFEKRQVNVRQEIARACPFVGDPTRLRRMIAHLVENAERFTPPHGEVVLRLYSVEEGIVFEVADNGIGISPDYLGEIVELFVRAPVPREQMEDSMGLGLTVVSAIVKAHGGTMEINSKLGKGTTVTVELPAAANRLNVDNTFEGTGTWILSRNNR